MAAELGSIIEFLENKTFLVTGATGYLAKIFVEKILRVQPNVKKMYLLLRASDAKSAMQRLQQDVVEKELFKVLKEKYGENLNSFISEKVRAVAGDISCEDLGIKDSSLTDELLKEVDYVVNCAASTNFNERYDVALGINTFGALNVMNFAKKCDKVKMLVHVSTAYVCGEDGGLILEKPLSLGKSKNGSTKVEIEVEKKLVQEKLAQLLSENASQKETAIAMKKLGLERAKLHGWPNTYVFSKAMSEMHLVASKDNLPLVIIRPSMIISTYQEPFPGWIEGAKTIDSVIAAYGKGRLECFVYNPETVYDLIPADMVVNNMIVAMVAREKKYSTEIVYQSGSSSRNQVTLSNIDDFMYRYFAANPLFEKDGKPIQYHNLTLINSMSAYRLYLAIQYLLPFKALQLASSFSKRYEDMYMTLGLKIRLLTRFVEFYKPYTYLMGIFDDTNSENLRKALKETCPTNEAEIFNFDPTTVDWDDFVVGHHIPGLVKYGMN
ncbi:fatty acyl-CoA reductase 3-like isoform X1 [Euphorbia lathyris]|uniref:fatty acyl-CoA reductase 3-like isoform X1 n=1 Tax=Euphorbia lathyris TaxID=212925 RepID=UPI003313DE5A